MKLYLLSTLAILAAISGTAQAESPFEGFYIGGGIGNGAAERTWTGGTLQDSGFSFNVRRIYGGYSYALNEQFILGAELSISSDLRETQGFNDDGSYNWRNNHEFRSTSLGARIGYMLDEKLFPRAEKILPYVAFGWADPSYYFQGLDGGNPADYDVTFEDDSATYYGLGVDYAIDDNLTARLEWRSMGSFSWPNNDGGITTETHNTVMVGIGYRF